jgi:hypothetical protein
MKGTPMTIWIENPPARKRRTKATAARKTKRKPPKGFRTWKAYMASIRPGAKRNSPKRKRKAPVAARRKTTRKRTTRRRATTTRRRRTYRRNPPRGQLARQLTDGAMHAVSIVGGKAAVGIVSGLLPATLPSTGVGGMAVKAGTAIAVGLVAGQFLPRDVADYVLAGALSKPIEDQVVALGIPHISPALAAYPNRGRQLAAYAQARRRLAGSGRNLNGAGGMGMVSTQARNVGQLGGFASR